MSAARKREPVALIAGSGALPRLIARSCREAGQECRVVFLAGEAPDWSARHDPIAARFERLGALFAALREAGCGAVTFAGAMRRPRLDPAAFDAKTREVMPRLLPLLGQGDDRLLGAVAALFEQEGFRVFAAQDIAPGLVAAPGTMSRATPGRADLADIETAAGLVVALGATDTGQGAVVAQGLCLALETLPGTDAMLQFVADHARDLRPDPEGARGVLFKAPKPAQDRRFDLPAIGPATIEGAARAGLAGVAVEAGGVLMLKRAETLAVADRLGLFVHGRAAGT